MLATPSALLRLAVASELQHARDRQHAAQAAAITSQCLQNPMMPLARHEPRLKPPPCPVACHPLSTAEHAGRPWARCMGGQKAHPLGEPCSCQQLAVLGELDAGQHIAARGGAVAAGSAVQVSEGHQAGWDGVWPLAPVRVEVPQRRVLTPGAAWGRGRLSASSQGGAGCSCMCHPSRPPIRFESCPPECQPCCSAVLLWCAACPAAGALCTQLAPEGSAAEALLGKLC